MTTIKINDKNIIIAGHSGYGTIGTDIVCSSISTAVMFLVETSIGKFNDYGDGHMVIECGGMNNDVKAVFIEYINELQEQYPKNVKVISNKILKEYEKAYKELAK